MEKMLMDAATFTKVVSEADDGIYITDVSGKILYANEAIARIVGLQPDQMVGRFTRLFDSGTMEPEYFERLWNTVLSGRVWREQVVNKRQTGESYRASQTITPHPIGSDTPSFFIAIQRDLTRQVELQPELNVGRSEIDSLLKQTDDMNREIFHRITNDLSLARSMIGLQEARAEHEETRLELRAASERIAAIENLYSVLQPEELAASVDLELVFSSLVDYWQEVYADIVRQIDTKLCHWNAPGRLSRSVSVIANELIMNAVKHRRDPARRLTVRLELEARDGEIVVVVVCDGSSYPDNVISGEAWGLGLTFVDSLAVQHGGYVLLSNESGARTEVHLKV